MFGRYLLASVAALVVDVGALALAVHALAWSADVAAGVGYSTGAILHYWLSRRFVFAVGWLDRARWAEFAAFVASGLCGLAVTVGVVHLLAERLGAPVAAAKAAAVLVSFVAVYLLRVVLVFRPSTTSS